MSAFTAALDALFLDDNLADDGVYTPAAGGAVSVRVIQRRKQEPTDVFSVGQVVNRLTADIRVSDISSAADGDALDISSTTYTVRNPQRKDSAGLIWTVELQEL